MSFPPSNHSRTSKPKVNRFDVVPKQIDFSSSESDDDQEQVTSDTQTPGDTISLKSLDGETIHPDSYQSPDEKSDRVDWVLVGQPDSQGKDDTEDPVEPERTISPHSALDPPELDLDRQKNCSKLHIQRRIKYIKKALESMEFCDLSFLFGKSATPAHAMLFRAHSDFCTKFPELCPRKPASVKKPLQLDLYGEVSPTAFRAVMDFVYEGQCEVPYEYLAEIIAAGEFFGLAPLNEEIQDTVENLLCDDNLLPIIFHGDCDHPVKELAWVKLLHRITFIVEQGEFVALELAELCQIMSSDGLNIPTEYDIFKACYEWLCADRTTRFVHFSRVMSCVRFHYMTPRELTKCQSKDPLFSTCKPVADNIALAYVARPFLLEKDSDFCERFELSPPRNQEILRHFTTFKEKTTLSNCAVISSRFQSYRKGPPNTASRPARNLPTIVSGVYADFNTLEDIKEISEDMRHDPKPSIARSAMDSRRDVQAAKINPQVLPVSTRKLSDVPIPDSRLSERLGRKPARSASPRSDSSSVGGFSQMTFNENGSLITWHGGKDAYRTLNQAFDRIYKK